MRTLPLFSSVAHTPSGVAAAGACAAATGTGCDAGAVAAGAGDVVGPGTVEATLVSSSFLAAPRLRPFRLRPGAVILIQESASQFLGASTWILWPLISKVMPLPACAAVL